MQTLKEYRSTLECTFAGGLLLIASRQLYRHFPAMWRSCRLYHNWLDGTSLAKTSDLGQLKKGPFPTRELTMNNLTTTPSLALFQSQSKQIDDFGIQYNLLLPHSGKCISFNGEYAHPQSKRPIRMHFDCAQAQPWVSSAILCYNHKLATMGTKKGNLRKLEMTAQVTVMDYDAGNNTFTVVSHSITSTREETQTVFKVILQYRLIHLAIAGVLLGVGSAVTVENLQLLMLAVQGVRSLLEAQAGEKKGDKPESAQ